MALLHHTLSTHSTCSTTLLQLSIIFPSSIQCKHREKPNTLLMVVITIIKVGAAVISVVICSNCLNISQKLGFVQQLPLQLPLQLPFTHPPHLQQLVLAHLYHPPSQGLIVAKYGIWQQWFSGEYRDHICRFVRLFFPSFYLNSQPQTRPYFWPIICLSTFAYSTF